MSNYLTARSILELPASRKIESVLIREEKTPQTFTLWVRLHDYDRMVFIASVNINSESTRVAPRIFKSFDAVYKYLKKFFPPLDAATLKFHKRSRFTKRVKTF
jgi:hypothetical protein